MSTLIADFIITNNEIDVIIGFFNYFQTGSRVIGGATDESDYDYVFVYSVDKSKALQQAGFVISPHEEYPGQRIKACYRKGAINLIGVEDQTDYDKWLKATRLACMMDLKEKHQRVTLFQFITEGKVRNTSVEY